MTCEHVTLPSGASAIVCGRFGPRDKCACGRTAILLCDWKLRPGERGRRAFSTTCDRPICARCSTSPAAGKDLCKAHAAAYDEWLAARGQAA